MTAGNTARFDAAFKANVWNVRLLEAALASQQRLTRADEAAA